MKIEFDVKIFLKAFFFFLGIGILFLILLFALTTR